MQSGIFNGCWGSASCWCRSDAVWHLQELVKLSMLLALFGGCGKYGTEPGMGKRGSIHVLICGDPGLGKSQLLQVCQLTIVLVAALWRFYMLAASLPMSSEQDEVGWVLAALLSGIQHCLAQTSFTKGPHCKAMQQVVGTNHQRFPHKDIQTLSIPPSLIPR